MKVTLPAIYDLLLKVDKKLDPVPGQVSDHENRIRALERQVWAWVGVAALGGSALTAFVVKAITTT